MPMDDEALRKEILVNLDDDAPRLRLADHLSAAGDPRGEFTRMQCQLHKMIYYDPGYWRLTRKSRELLQSHRREWLDGFEDQQEWIQFDRGFPSFLAIASPMPTSLRLLDRFPTIESVLLQSREEFADNLSDPAHLAALRQGRRPRMIRSTSLSVIRQCTDKLISLADRIRAVSADYASHFEELFDSIFRDERWRRIDFFNCYGRNWSDARLLDLLQSRLWKQLRVVMLRAIPPLPHFINAIRRLPPTHVESIYFHDLNKPVMDAFLQDGKLDHVRRISLVASGVDSLESLAAGDALPNLEYLSLTTLATQDASRLLTWELGARIKALRMSMTELPEDFFSTLRQSPFQSLELLEVKPDVRHARSLRSFVGTDSARGLTLHLNSIPGGLLASIAEAPLADGLRINLALATADDDVIRALIETPLHAHITVLDVTNGNISQQALQKLIDFTGFPLLESAGLTLNADEVPDSMKQELERKFGPESIRLVPRHLMPDPH